MTLLFEPVRNAMPTPSSVEGAANKNKSLLRRLGARAADKSVRRDYRGGAYSGRKTADHSTAGNV
jgi:hypothetical protein